MSRAVPVIAFSLAASTALAQQQPRPACPAVDGVVATAPWFADATGAETPSASGLRQNRRAIVDTTWTFVVRERRWNRPSFAASVGAGWTGGSPLPALRGMSTARDAAAAGDWNVCAAVSIGMREPTVVLRNARGTVHLRADLSALTRSATPPGDTTTRPR